MMASNSSQLYLFGGDKPWDQAAWTASDDRVRGGSSVSHLECTSPCSTAVFNGHLDTKTLGGAGFASQRTTGEDKIWNLSKYDGLEIHVTKSDDKKYTFILKNELLPKSPNGREQSTLSWEYDFKIGNASAQSQGGKVSIAWNDFKATYRGREKKDAKPLDTARIKRMSIMMRSFFATQDGDFSLSIASIAATTARRQADPHSLFTEPGPYRDDPKEKDDIPVEWAPNKSGSSPRRKCLASCVVS